MQRQYDLEINILSCLLQKPELMQQIKLEDKHFVNYQSLWQFFKVFYTKYGTFDITLMFNVCQDKKRLVTYLTWLMEADPFVEHFDLYQDELIKQYNENKKERVIINHIYELANQMFVNELTLGQFYDKIEEIKKRGEEDGR